jgi:superfamily II DNA helicase RecQ
MRGSEGASGTSGTSDRDAPQPPKRAPRFLDADLEQPLSEEMTNFMNALEDALRFRPSKWQAIAIQGILTGNDVLVKAGTSSGKSLCYQALALCKMRPKAIVLVIVPTIALMEDAVSYFTRNMD